MDKIICFVFVDMVIISLTLKPILSSIVPYSFGYTNLCNGCNSLSYFLEMVDKIVCFVFDRSVIISLALKPILSSIVPYVIILAITNRSYLLLF